MLTPDEQLALSRETSPAREAAASAAGRIFEALVTTELRECAAEAFEDEAEGEAAAAGGGGDDASELEQSFARTAALGRAAPGNAMLAIAGAIHDRLQRLQQCLAEGQCSTCDSPAILMCVIGACLEVVSRLLTIRTVNLLCMNALRRRSFCFWIIA